MGEGWFSKPVSVAVGVAGNVRIVESAREAIKMLSENWRSQGSEKHKAATRACQAAVRGDTAPDVARQAFVDAAEEARVLAG
ncbi:DUF982 domain-containing protein [Mesorhizobium sp. SP-1A]|uniref:DUF982 domain-containing protein n=1 Tax=Mesorhizobium sp. SP-1A TaxID=3077840 RepID=UPI0028F73E54|nr:DUF982 domain-containing protein [Mesorhizobium sp. SP-1A]